MVLNHVYINTDNKYVFLFRYGLVLPKKNQLAAPKAGNIFGDEDSEDEGSNNSFRQVFKQKNIRKQALMDMEKALKEDPTIYQYDEIYDEIEQKKEEDSIKKVDKKPKYIENLMKTAERRKREQEKRIEKQVQKEREAEGDQFKDKEKFVTSAYKAKLEELKKLQDEEDREAQMEELCDVTKQNDLGGFYRHIYRQAVDKNEIDRGIIPKPSKIIEEKKPDSQESFDIDKDDPIVSDSESDDSKEPKIESQSLETVKKTKRQYRQRNQEESSSSESDNEHDKVNPLDKDQDEPELKKQKELEKDKNTSLVLQVHNESKKVDEFKNTEVIIKKENTESVKEKKETQEMKPKINIWAKRTVGPVFEAALQRYLDRKSLRMELKSKLLST